MLRFVNNGHTKGMEVNVSQQGKSCMVKRYGNKWTLLRKICSEISLSALSEKQILLVMAPGQQEDKY